MRALLVALLIFGACHHDPGPAAPADPSDKPPLPPASGTPIGFLIDDAGELKLSDDQVAKLRDIDTTLAADLEKIDAATRAANRPADGDAAPPPQQGGRHGGRHGGGGMGGTGGAGGGHHKRGSGSGASPSAQASLGKLSDQRNADVKDALQRAFALFDGGQQVTAKKVLADHDVDLEVGSVGGSAAGTGVMPTPEPGEGDPPPEP